MSMQGRVGRGERGRRGGRGDDVHGIDRLWLVRSTASSRDFVSDFSNFASEQFGFPEVFLDPGRFRKVREACRNHFHLFSSKFIARIPSYDQKPSEVHDY